MSGRLHRVVMFLYSHSPLSEPELVYVFCFSICFITCRGDSQGSIFLRINSRSPPMNRNPEHHVLPLFIDTILRGSFYAHFVIIKFMTTFAPVEIHSGGVGKPTPILCIYIV